MDSSAGHQPPAGGRSVDVVIVAYGAKDLLRACLQSLRDHPLRRGEMTVHVVDNASPDDLADMVSSEFPEVRLHVLTDNRGFSYANNVVLRESEADYVLVLNPDTEATEGALDHMVDLMEARLDVGMSGCRLVQLDGTFDHAAKRGFPTPMSALAHFTGVGRRDAADGRLSQYRATDLDEHEVGEVDAVNGAFMLVRHEAMKDVGLFDEGYWLYMEDLDWCYRFWQSGWKVLYDGTATFVHVKAGSSGKHRRWRQNWAFHRGMGRFYRKFYAGKNPLTDAAVFTGILGKLAISATRSAVARRSLS